jgi:hypothetical protein
LPLALAQSTRAKPAAPDNDRGARRAHCLPDPQEGPDASRSPSRSPLSAEDHDRRRPRVRGGDPPAPLSG